jgi:hypothetical protein
MMPMMMQDMDLGRMDEMMNTMMHRTMDMMEQKGIDMFEMMKKMCPKCLSGATSRASGEEKARLKSQMTDFVDKI